MHDIYLLNMLKNKDGSYNKFSLLILGAIVAIALLIIGSLVFSSDTNIDANTLSTIGLFGCGGIALYYAYKIIRNKKTIHSSMEPVVVKPESSPSDYTPSKNLEVRPVSKIDEEIDKSIRRYEEKKSKQTSGSPIGSSMVTAIITMVVAAVTLIIGVSVANSLVNSLPTLPEGSAFSTTQTELANTMGTAFNFMAIGLFVLGAIMIIGLLAKVVAE